MNFDKIYKILVVVKPAMQILVRPIFLVRVHFLVFQRSQVHFLQQNISSDQSLKLQSITGCLMISWTLNRHRVSMSYIFINEDKIFIHNKLIQI